MKTILLLASVIFLSSISTHASAQRQGFVSAAEMEAKNAAMRDRAKNDAEAVEKVKRAEKEGPKYPAYAEATPEKESVLCKFSYHPLSDTGKAIAEAARDECLAGGQGPAYERWNDYANRRAATRQRNCISSGMNTICR